MAAEAQLSAQQPAPPWEPIGVIGTVIMVIGAEIIFIIGATVIAGSVHQAADHMWCRLDIAVDACRPPFVSSRTYLRRRANALLEGGGVLVLVRQQTQKPKIETS